MLRKNPQKSATANQSSFFFNSIFLVIIFFLAALIKIGAVFLWPFKHIPSLYKTSKDKITRRLNRKFWDKKNEELIKQVDKLTLRAKQEVLATKEIVLAGAQTINAQLISVRNNIGKILGFFGGLKTKIPKLNLRLLGKSKRKKAAQRKEKVIYRRVSLGTKIKYLFLGMAASLILIVLPLIVYFWLKELPNPQILTTRDIPATTKIYDRNGALLYQIYGGENRTLIKLKDLPLSLREDTIAIEDKDFYHHLGVSWKGIIRAVWVNLSSGQNNGRPLQGGSSITQQLIKSALLTPEPTLTRKIKEVVLAFWAERIYSKNQILEMYFNQVPYGGTAWGVEAAAETYFNKKVSRLDLAESALLAGLPAAPTLYSPFGAHPELAQERQKEVLRRLVEDKYITSEEADRAAKETLNYAAQTTEIKAPHFVMWVKELLVKKYGERLVEQGGLNVLTSLDLNIQNMAQKEVTTQVEQLKNLAVGNGAALVTNPQTGEILAMVGSKDYFDLKNDGNVNVALALRQPGSAIKPIMYAAALQRGFTAATVLDDAPVTYQIPGQPPYQPVNYDGKWHGKITLRTALASSFNVPAVKVLNTIGVKAMIDIGKQMGITTWDDESRFGLSLTLGGGEVLMTDMAKAYGVLANGGKRTDLKPILKVTDYRGNVLEQALENDAVQVLPPEIAYILSSILADNNARALGFGLNSALNISGKTVSVKTGTTNDKRDNWTIGYTPSYLVAVWVGNNDNSPMNPYLTSGITGAAPIWHNIMTSLLQNKNDEPIVKSGNITAVPICAWNGMLPCEGCPTITEYFVSGTEPATYCKKITSTPTPTP